jgi:hypothetical protein
MNKLKNKKKKRIIYLIYIINVIVIISCKDSDMNEINNNDHLIQTQKSDIDNEENLSSSICIIPDSNEYKLKHTELTLNTDDGLLISKMNILNDEQIQAWINPLISKIGIGTLIDAPLYYRMASFQKGNENYYSILVLLHGELDTDNSKPNLVSLNQFLININKNGCYIDGILLQRYTPGSSLGDSSLTSKGLLLNIDKRSRMLNDTVKIYDKEKYLNPPHSSNENDTWEELYETIYFINKQGEFKLIVEKQKVKDSRQNK